MSDIAFIDLKAQQARIRDAVEKRLIAVLDHGAYINGPEIAELEEALKARTGAADVVAVSSGTDALVIALMAEGIGAGDAVFIPAFTYNATANAVLMCNAEPVFCDVSADTFNIDIDDVTARIDAVTREGRLRPRAIIAVDLFGLPADYDALNALADRHGLLLISDAAQSYGGRLNGTPVGALAPVSTTSFFPAKTLGGYGDGGAMFSDSVERADIWRSIRWHGTDENRKESVRVGMNGRLDTFQAAVLLEKLKIFDEEWQARDRIARRYDGRLTGKVGLPRRPQAADSAHALYTILVKDRDGIQKAMGEKGIPTAVYYPQALHHMRAFLPYAPKGGLPVAERLTANVLSLPMHPYLTDAQVDRVCDTLESLL